MDDPYEMLIVDLAKRCDINRNQARNVVDFLERKDFIDMDEVESFYIKESEL